MEPTELSLLTKVKIVGSMAFVCVVGMALTLGVISYQRNAKVQAAELAKTQLANVEAMKTSFPDYKNTEEFKESAKMAMVKIRPGESKTVTLNGWQYGTDPNAPGDVFGVNGSAHVTKNPNGSVDANGFKVTWSPIPKNEDHSGAFGMSHDVMVYVPVGATPGLNSVSVRSETGRNYPGDTSTGHADPYTGQFKITPPCPTSVTLTAN